MEGDYGFDTALAAAPVVRKLRKARARAPPPELLSTSVS